MKINELLALTPEKESTDIRILFGFYYNHIKELKIGGIYEDNWSYLRETLKEQDRIVIKYYKEHYFDYRRIWALASVYFDGKPVMVIQNAGREGDDYSRRYIIDKANYIKMIQFIPTLIQPSIDLEIRNVVDPEQDIEGLDEFYGYKLNGYF